MRIHSPQITGSAANTNIVLTTITSSISVLSASFATTASFVQNAQSASFAITASHLLGQSPTSSYALTASFVSNALSASFAATASSADNLTVRGTLTAQTINVQTITSSIDYVTGSSINGSLLANTHQFTGSVNITGSLQVNESNVILTNQTSSMSVATASYWSGSIINAATASYVENAQSASYVQNAQTASYVLQAQSASYWSGSIINAATASYVENAQSASYVLQAQSASYWSGSIINAATASYVLNAVSASFALTASYISGSGGGVGFPFSGSAIITGSLFVSGSTISGSFVGDGSGITGLTAGGKIHTQTSAASTWTVSHNLGVQYPNVTVYNSSNEIIIPQTIVATDANTLTLTFGSAVAGYAVAGIGGIINVQGRTTQQYFTASTTWSFAHNLGDKYVSLQAFDDAFEMMIPTTIRLVDFTSSLMLFDSASSGYAVATIGGDLPAISSSYAGYTLQVASSAPYSASWVAAANVTVTNAVSSSFAATASSADNLTVRGTLTAQTINVQTITSSIEFITGSTRNGSLPSNTHQFTGSVSMTGSLVVTGSISTTENVNMGSPFMFRNKIINGAMMIDQRNNGSAITADGYPVDRFLIYEDGGQFTMQRSTTVPTGSGFINSLSITNGTGQAISSGNYTTIRHGIEGINTGDLAWGTANAKNITVSFWVRSSLTGNFGLALRNNANNYGYVASYNIPSADTWTYITTTIPGPTSGTWSTAAATRGINLIWDLGAGSLYSIAAGTWTSASEILGLTGGTKFKATTGATFNLTGVQLEIGNVATPFEHRPISIEESLCKRYYEKIVFSGGSYFVARVAGTQTYATIIYKTVKMSDPVVALPAVSTASDSTGHTAVSNGVHQGSWYATLGGGLTNNVNSYTFTAESDL